MRHFIAHLLLKKLAAILTPHTRYGTRGNIPQIFQITNEKMLVKTPISSIELLVLVADLAQVLF